MGGGGGGGCGCVCGGVGGVVEGWAWGEGWWGPGLLMTHPPEMRASLISFHVFHREPSCAMISVITHLARAKKGDVLNCVLKLLTVSVSMNCAGVEDGCGD